MDASALADLINATRRKQPQNVLSDASEALVAYSAAWFMRKSMRKLGGATMFEFDVDAADGPGNARWIGPYQPDVVNANDTTVKGALPMAKGETSVMIDEWETEVNGSTERLWDIVRQKEKKAMQDWAWNAERTLWRQGVSGDKAPYGVLTFLTYTAPTNADLVDFTGGNPTNFSAGYAGISSTTYPRWKNCCFKYTAADADDLIDKATKAKMATAWMSPFPVQGELQTQDRVWLTTRNNSVLLMKKARENNNNIGADVVAYGVERVDGQKVPALPTVHVAGHPVIHVPYFDETGTELSANPFIGLDFSTIHTMVGTDQSGPMFLRRNKAFQAPTMRHVTIMSWDSIVQFKNVKRRNQIYGSTAS